MGNEKNNGLILSADFARMCGTTKRTLFHYEQIGLFRPVLREENGYRYYAAEQYELFQIIDALRSIGMPLGEIRQYLQQRSPAALKELLETQERRITEELKRLEQIRGVIGTKRALLEDGASVRCGEPELKTRGEEYLLLSAPVSEGSEARVLREHLTLAAERGIRSGHPFGAMLKAEDVRRGIYDRYAYYFTKLTAPQDRALFRKPEGLYAQIHLRGDYKKPRQAMDTLMAFLREKGMEPWGYCYKEGIIDEIAAQDAEDYVTRISVAVRPL